MKGAYRIKFQCYLAFLPRSETVSLPPYFYFLLRVGLSQKLDG